MTCNVGVQDLKFSSVSVMILSIEHTSRVLVRWELVPTSQDLSNVFFFIDRSESSNEWQRLNASGIPANHLREFVDYTANLIDLNKNYHYRVI